MAISKAILIGFGHHGKNRLFKSLLSLPQIEEILVFARNPSLFAGIETKVNEKIIRITSNFEKMLEAASEETFVVVGITAKDRLDIIKKIVLRNVKYIYIEKPLAQSMADCDKMANIIERNNVSVAVGFYNDFLILTKNLDKIAKEHGMGELLKISSQGGALCLSTNGAHFIDLASVLFKSRPKEVLGKVNTTIKNPRGTDYLIYDGLGYVTYENDKELLLSFNNRSLNSPEIVLHFEYGYIEASHDSEYLRVMGFKSNSKDMPKYRCDKPVELARINNNNDFNKLFDRIFYNLLNGGVYCGIYRAMQDMQVLLSILISDKIGRRLELPIRSDNYYYHEKFPIT